MALCAHPAWLVDRLAEVAVPPEVAVAHAAEVARALSDAIRAWVTAPVDDDR